jgi:hypothetical protein
MLDSSPSFLAIARVTFVDLHPAPSRDYPLSLILGQVLHQYAPSGSWSYHHASSGSGHPSCYPGIVSLAMAEERVPRSREG